MKFKFELLKGTYLLSFFLMFSYFFAFVELIVQQYIFKASGGSIGWSFMMWIPLLVVIVISKLLLGKYDANTNLLNHIHYFGIYKLIVVFRSVFTTVEMYYRYSGYQDELFAEQMRLQAFDHVINVIFGLLLIYWGYRRMMLPKGEL